MKGLVMRGFAILAAGFVSITGFASVASAADLSAKAYTKAPPLAAPIYAWGGFYIGLNAGGASSHNCWNDTNSLGFPVPGAPSEGCHDATGALAGGQIGYRWQTTTWVLGLEAQGDWANLKGSNTSMTGTFGRLPFSNQTKIDAIGLFTAQVGYAWNNLLGYVKGGAAATDDTYNGVSQFAVNGLPAGFAFDQASETRWGGVVGTGIEFGFAPRWSAAIEYDHLFMGRSNANLINFTGAFDRTDSIKQDVDMGTVRVNYTFGGPGAAKY
jgi:outer membrane immunogenic protein